MKHLLKTEVQSGLNESISLKRSSVRYPRSNRTERKAWLRFLPEYAQSYIFLNVNVRVRGEDGLLREKRILSSRAITFPNGDAADRWPVQLKWSRGNG